MKTNRKVERYIAFGNELFAYNTFDYNLYSETVKKYHISQSAIIAFCALGYIKKISRGVYSPVSVAMTPQMVDAIRKYYVVKRSGVEECSVPDVKVLDKPSNKKINVDRLNKASDRQVIGVKAEASLKRFLYKRASGEKKTLSSYCEDVLSAHAKALKKQHLITGKEEEEEALPVLVEPIHVNANEVSPPVVKELRSFSILWGLVKFQF
jgi:hypothetical protein